MKRFGLYIYSILLAVTIIGFFSCEKSESYPVEPQITYSNFRIFTDTGTLGNPKIIIELNFDFIDGDGDIGSYRVIGGYTEIVNSDTSKYDLYVQKYSFIDTGFTAITDTGKYYLPYFEPEEKNSFLKGQTTVTLDYFNLKPDTFFYEFFIYDRKRHKSNIEYSDTLFLIPDSII